MIGRTLFRYVFWEMLRTLFVAVCWLMFVAVLVVVVRSRFTSTGTMLGPREVMMGMLLVAPYLFSFVLAPAVLAAAICTFGRMSADNELVAMRASGLSPLAVAVAPLLLGLSASLAILWLNVEGYGYAAAGLARWEDNIQIDVDDLAGPGRSFEVEVRDGRMNFDFPRPLPGGERSVRVSCINDGEVSFLLIARSFECSVELDRNAQGKLRRFVNFTLRDVEVVQDPLNPVRTGRFKEWSITGIELRGQVARGLMGGGSAMRASLPGNLARLKEKRATLAADVAYPEKLLVAARSWMLASAAGAADPTRIAPQVHVLARHQVNTSKVARDLASEKAEISRKLAFSFSPLFFALLGMGLGSLARKSSKLIGLSLGVLVTALYYGAWVSAKAVSFYGWLPPELASWVPNLLAAAGIWAASRAGRRA